MSTRTAAGATTAGIAIALDRHRVHRNFMGYTVMPASDQVGVGVTAIGEDITEKRRNEAAVAGQKADERAFRNGVRMAGLFALLLGLFVFTKL